MRTIKLTTGAEVPLDGDLMTVIESLYLEITAKGGNAIAVQADVADENAVAALFDTAEREFGGIDVVVNAAGAWADMVDGFQSRALRTRPTSNSRTLRPNGVSSDVTS